MITAARLLYAHTWKYSEIPTMEGYLVKMIELAEMARMICLIRERTMSSFITDWKPLMEFFAVEKKRTCDLWV